MQLGRPVFFKRLGAPGAEAFAVLFALESFARALLVTMIPVEALRYLGDAGGVSSAFFACSLCALTRSEEHTSELQSLMRISYAVFCLKKKTKLTYQKP